MDLSIFSSVIKGETPEEVARKTRGYGLQNVQFIPNRAEIGFGYDTRTAEASFERWAEAYRREGIGVCGVGGYINILHHDAERRRLNVEAIKSWLRAMQVLGCRYLSTETGSYAVTGDWDFDPRNRTPEAWDDLRRVTDELLEVATREDVVLLYEPYIVNVCHTPGLGARLVREVDSPHLALLMDPTNWFDAETARPECVVDVLERGFAAERGLYRLAHAKDVTPPPPDRPKPGLPGPGKGILDYAAYLRLLAEQGYSGPLIIEHLTEPDVPDAVAYVRGFVDRQAAEGTKQEAERS
jgi:sugar phosphate isomerase/epimerase